MNKKNSTDQYLCSNGEIFVNEFGIVQNVNVRKSESTGDSYIGFFSFEKDARIMFHKGKLDTRWNCISDRNINPLNDITFIFIPKHEYKSDMNHAISLRYKSVESEYHTLFGIQENKNYHIEVLFKGKDNGWNICRDLKTGDAICYQDTFIFHKSSGNINSYKVFRFEKESKIIQSFYISREITKRNYPPLQFSSDNKQFSKLNPEDYAALQISNLL